MRIAVVVLAIIASVFGVVYEIRMRDSATWGWIAHAGEDVEAQAELCRKEERAVQLRQTGECLAGAIGVVAAVLALRTLPWRRFAAGCAGLFLLAAAVILFAGNVFSAILFGLAALLSFLKVLLARGAGIAPADGVLQLLDVLMIAVMVLAIVASVSSAGYATATGLPGTAPSGAGADAVRDATALALRAKVGGYLAGGIGMIACILALCCLETRRGATACGALLVVATMAVALWTVSYPLTILFGAAAGLAFAGAFLARGVSVVPARALIQWVLRIVGILGYLFGSALLCACLSWPLYVLWRGYPFPQVTWPLQIGLCAFFFVVLTVGVLLARWGANRFYAGVAIAKGKFTGHLVAVPVAGILCWLAIARPEGDNDIAQLFFVGGSVLFLVATIDGLITLIRYKPFRWHTYILMGLGVGCAFASLMGPTFFATHAAIRSAQRSSTFATAIAHMESAVGYKDLADAMREPKQVRGRGGLEGALLVLDAQFDGREGPCHLRASSAERYLPQTWLAKDEESLRFVVVVGPFGALPSSQLFGSPTWGCPFLVFDWPRRELLQQGTLRLSQPGGMPRKHYPDAIEGRLCDAAKELAQQLSSISAPTGVQRRATGAGRRPIENVAPPSNN